MDSTTFVGIDVSKNQLDIALHPSGRTWTCANEPSGFATLIPQLQTCTPLLIVLEATGGLERPLAARLS